MLLKPPVVVVEIAARKREWDILLPALQPGAGCPGVLIATICAFRAWQGRECLETDCTDVCWARFRIDALRALEPYRVIADAANIDQRQTAQET